jgi:hypothetical protein
VAADVGVGLVEHDPLPGEEAGIQAAARVREALAPRAAHGAEADVVGDAAGEDELGDQAGRTVAAEVRPVPRGARALVPPFRTWSWAGSASGRPRSRQAGEFGCGSYTWPFGPPGPARPKHDAAQARSGPARRGPTDFVLVLGSTMG